MGDVVKMHEVTDLARHASASDILDAAREQIDDAAKHGVFPKIIVVIQNDEDRRLCILGGGVTIDSGVAMMEKAKHRYLNEWHEQAYP